MTFQASLDEIKNDLASFKDPGTLVHVNGSLIRFTRDRRERELTLIQGGGGFPEVKVDGKTFTYPGFLASEHMADLLDLARSIQTLVAPVDRFVSPPAVSADSDGKPVTAVDAIAGSTLAADLPFGSTRVLFVHGNAGAGKTSLLRHLTRRQADAYANGESNALLLYLDAQGKGLAQLEDVISRALQDLRARFTYHCLAPLTRRRCIVPIIDGFDELIGPNSAREAFGNLAQFLAQLGRQGAVITSSRSAFIDYKTLHERATEIATVQGLSYEIFPVELKPWDNGTIFDLADDLLPAGRAQIETLLQSPAGHLIRKPFFLTKVCEILAEGNEVSGEKDLVRQVVDAAVFRESTKLQDRQQRPILTPAQHKKFCQALADEMWLQERPDLDKETITTIADIFADEAGLPPAEGKVLIDRSIAHGLLTLASGDADRRTFEHELFRFDLQADGLRNALLGDVVTLRDYLSRRELPQDLAERACADLPVTATSAVTLCKTVNEARRGVERSPYARSNAGILVANILLRCTEQVAGGELTGLEFRYVDLGHVRLKGWQIRDCTFERADFSGVHLEDSAVNGSIFSCCKFSPSSSLRGSPIDPSCVVGLNWTETGETYDPVEIASILLMLAGGASASGLQPSSESRSAEVELLERFLKRAQNHFYFSEDDAWVRKNLQSDRWKTLEKALRSHDLIEDVTIQKSGPKTPLWKLRVPPDTIMAGRSGAGPANVLALWRDVIAA